VKNEDTKSKAEGDHDKIHYMALTHGEFLKLTRYLWGIPFGELTNFHKAKANEMEATSPSVVYVRAIIFARLVAAQERGGGGP
jgi:hypothetical protein